MTSLSALQHGAHARTRAWRIPSLLLVLALLVAAEGVGTARADPTVLFAAPGGAGTGPCDLWATACNLQYAISVAVSTEQIWAKQGTYLPTGDRSDSFMLKNGVSIYGGFAGTETLLSQRNPATHVTILSGDIGTGGDTSDNSYHVVVGSGTDLSAVLDGLTITAGNANGGGQPDFWGGGMYNESGSPTLTNLTFSGNLAVVGGGVANDQSSPILENVTFSGNTAEFGGGMYNYQSSNPTLTNVTFSGNSATVGGGIANLNLSSPTLTNVTFSGNTFAVFGVMYNDNSSPFIYSSIFWDSGTEIATPSGLATIQDSIVGGGCPFIGADCTHVINPDPLLGPLADNGGFTQTMALGAGSPALDAGGVNFPCALTDQRGISRPQGYGCDMGAYELERLFADVPFPGKEWMEPWIEAFYYAGITTGCGQNPLIYCPENQVTRAEMAVFLLRAKHGGAGYQPPAASNFFSDVPVLGKEWMEPWIDEYYREGLTTGCGNPPLIFCPENNATRAEMAVFVMRAVHIPGYAPPPLSHFFSDMPVTGKEWMEPWVDEYYREGITTGCGPGLYCPENNVTRAEMAVFIGRAYHLYP